jgi:type I restriction enzyme S subunit
MKASGLAWAPEIPADWTVKKLGFLATLASGDSITTDDIRDEGPYAVYGGNGLRGYTDRFTHEGEYALIGRQGALCGNINYAKGQFWASEHAVVVTPREELEIRWLGELLRAMDLNQYSASAAQPGLAVETIAALKIPIPPLDEQRSIAKFLDRETAQIDASIAAKERLLQLLAEKRRALITRAVTRGLDPNVLLRDSGISWLGEIPAHWSVDRIRFLVTRIEQGWSPQAENREPQPEEWGVLKLNAVAQGWFDAAAAKALPGDVEPVHSLEVQNGDFLLTRSNTPSSVGDACFVESTRPRLMLSDLIYRLTLRSEVIDGRFLSHFLTLPVGRKQIEADARGTSASMVKISQEHIKNWLTPVPPIDEQRAILAALSEELAPIRRSHAVTERTIVLLRERRAALIAAAVTGQVQVA